MSYVNTSISGREVECLEWGERVSGLRGGGWIVEVEEERGIAGGVGMKIYHLSEARVTS